ncbi:hypothetical protein FQN60_014913 [Etheostoma spectabile]|uniref:Uncharacterized protein n=1 Tax=Etheostoma spectabile TaxID=54343 RepID=A0A5J5CTL8_9PERO|nr:hypothetical protein FQN60_014913 [Etheostoma spectabile]
MQEAAGRDRVAKPPPGTQKKREEMSRRSRSVEELGLKD